MTGMLLALIAVVLAGIGARDQVMVARIAARNGAGGGLLLTAVAMAAICAGLAAWAATAIAPMLTPKARMIFACLALAVAGVESLLVQPGRRPQEPTHSLGALAIVLFASQLTDAARFLVLAIAVATAAPVAAGIGGAAGGAVVMTAAWLSAGTAPGLAEDPRLRLARRLVGAALLALAGGLVLPLLP